ncbi:MAG TPA: hypothetical protein VJ875_04880 [Pyrinomonadaceae bacterium]|nr:hypothetical protein [Pyrinomonadaceae bacterium]
MRSKFHLVASVTYRVVFAIALVMLCGISAVPQNSGSTITGRWIWKQVARKNKPQTQFTLVIRRDGNLVSGIYSVDEFVNGKWQGEDGNQTPFVGRLKGSEIELEFDPLAVHPGYEQNVSYAAPSDGRKPSLVNIRYSETILRWRLVRGPGIQGVPANVVLRRELQGDRVDFSEGRNP